jgi:hypothetical protein
MLAYLDSADWSLWRTTKRVMRDPTPSPPLLVRKGLVPDREKAEALARLCLTQVDR